MPDTPRVAVAQLGARMHYAVPRILHEEGMLSHFFTDACAVKGWPRLLRHTPTFCRPAPLRRLLARVPHGVPVERITAFSSMGYRHAREMRASRSEGDVRARRNRMFQEFCERVVQEGFADANTTYTYNAAGLEIMRAARGRGMTAITEQTIAPAAVEQKLLATEAEKHPEWPSPIAFDGYADRIEREAEEWRLASAVICGSQFVADGVRSIAPGDNINCIVVPYGVDTSNFQQAPSPPPRGGRPLRVLTVGTLGLRKGTPYTIRAASELRGLAEFRLVGPGRVPDAVLRDLPDNVDLRGQVPRSEIADHYRWADLFMLPSICEGSSIATYEAILAGLPVICTANTGAIVRDGENAMLIAAGDHESIVSGMTAIASDPCITDAFFKAPVHVDASKQASLSSYKPRLLEAVCSAAVSKSVA